jgi:hypothetical protein
MRRLPGRKSADSKALNIDGSPPPLVPPSYLNPEERKLFQEIISSCDPRMFAQSDSPLLVSYVQSTLLSRRLSKGSDPKAIMLWEKATRMQATLATKLRLAPQARLSQVTAARRQEYKAQDPWTLRPSSKGNSKHADDET